MLLEGNAVAKQAFAALVSERVNDQLAIFHLVRLLAGENGIEISLTKG